MFSVSVHIMFVLGLNNTILFLMSPTDKPDVFVSLLEYFSPSFV